MKTPLQELIELWEKQKNEAPPFFPARIYDLFIKDINKYLEKEKQMVIDAYDKCEYNQNHLLRENWIDGEQYFKDTYNER